MRTGNYMTQARFRRLIEACDNTISRAHTLAHETRAGLAALLAELKAANLTRDNPLAPSLDATIELINDLASRLETLISVEDAVIIAEERAVFNARQKRNNYARNYQRITREGLRARACALAAPELAPKLAPDPFDGAKFIRANETARQLLGRFDWTNIQARSDILATIAELRPNEDPTAIFTTLEQMDILFEVNPAAKLGYFRLNSNLIGSIQE